MRRRSASVTTVSRLGVTVISAPVAAPAETAAAGVAAERVQVGRRELEAERPGEVEHVVARCG